MYPPPARASKAFWYVALIAAACGCAVAFASHQGLAYQYYSVIALSGVHLALLCAIARAPSFSTLRQSQVFFMAALIGSVALLSRPLLEDDYFRYLWDGYITATSGRPYAFAPAAFFADESLPAVMQSVLSGINYPELPTIYGPVLQAIFALCYGMAPAALWPLQLLLCLATIACARLLCKEGVAPRWVLAFVLHPLLIKEAAISAHPDLFIGLALLAGVMAWRRGAALWAGVLLGLAVAMKFSLLVVLPLFFIDQKGRLSWRSIAAAALTLGVVYAPVLISSAGSEGRALQAMAAQWVFNPLLFKLARAAFSDQGARLLVLMLFACVWMGAVLRWIRQLRRRQHTPSDAASTALPEPPVIPVLFALLLLTPVLNPWYWLWLLPLAILQRSRSVWVAATFSLLAYAHFGESLREGLAFTRFDVPLWATGAQLIAIATAMAWEFVRRKHLVAPPPGAGQPVTGRRVANGRLRIRWNRFR